MGLKDLTKEQLLEIKERDEKKQQEQRDEEIYQNVKILIEACNIGQRHGAYTLAEARHIMNAIDALNDNSQSYTV